MPDYAALKRLIWDAGVQNGYNLLDKNFDWCLKLQVAQGFSSGTRPSCS